MRRSILSTKQNAPFSASPLDWDGFAVCIGLDQGRSQKRVTVLNGYPMSYLLWFASGVDGECCGGMALRSLEFLSAFESSVKICLVMITPRCSTEAKNWLAAKALNPTPYRSLKPRSFSQPQIENVSCCFQSHASSAKVFDGHKSPAAQINEGMFFIFCFPPSFFSAKRVAFCGIDELNEMKWIETREKVKGMTSFGEFQNEIEAVKKRANGQNRTP